LGVGLDERYRSVVRPDKAEVPHSVGSGSRK
jgi:hypothetical protein